MVVDNSEYKNWARSRNKEKYFTGAATRTPVEGIRISTVASSVILPVCTTLFAIFKSWISDQKCESQIKGMRIF